MCVCGVCLCVCGVCLCVWCVFVCVWCVFVCVCGVCVCVCVVCVCVVCVCVLRCSVFFHFQGIWRICFLFFACFDSLLKDGLLERILIPSIAQGDRSSTVVKALCYKSEGRWFDPSWCHWILH